VEDGLDFVLDLRHGSCTVHTPAVLIVHLFPVLFIRDISSHHGIPLPLGVLAFDIRP